MYRGHGEKYRRKFPVEGGGKTVYIRHVRYCVVHGEIDLLLFPNFDLEHGECSNTPTRSAAAVLVFKKAA